VGCVWPCKAEGIAVIWYDYPNVTCIIIYDTPIISESLVVYMKFLRRSVRRAHQLHELLEAPSYLSPLLGPDGVPIPVLWTIFSAEQTSDLRIHLVPGNKIPAYC
jgi:hypothetical protein